MLSNNLVSSAMATNIVPLYATSTLQQAVSAFSYSDLRHLPVLEEGKVVGMIGKSDVERVQAAYTHCVEKNQADANAFENIPVSTIMSQNPVAIQSFQTLEEAAEILTERAFRALPVLKGKELVGVISTTSLMQYVVSEMGAQGVFI